MEDPVSHNLFGLANDYPVEIITETTLENIDDIEDTSKLESEQTVVHPTLFPTKSLFELSKAYWSRSPKATEELQPYLRGCKWSPDGTCCLTVVNNDGTHVMELSHDLYDGSVSPERVINVMDSVIHVKECGLIYDFCWYPGMNSGVPDSCCWLTARQNAPVQLWDAFDGSLRCTYRGYNSVDEVEPALTACFSTDGQKVITGYKKCLRTFDTDRPGRDCSDHAIKSPASCLVTNGSLLAVGSWNTSISLYNINEMGTYKSIGKMHGHSGGITHMKFTPDGTKLVTGARKDHRLLVWDIRFYRRPLNILNRIVDTNQRIYFDISPCGRYLVSGGTDGVLKVWDRNVTNWDTSMEVEDSEDGVFKFSIHNDCCNSVSIHPCRPILATGSGQYHSKDPITTLDTEIDVQNKTDTSDMTIDTMSSAIDSSKISETVESVNCSENSLLFWWIGDL